MPGPEMEAPQCVVGKGRRQEGAVCYAVSMGDVSEGSFDHK